MWYHYRLNYEVRSDGEVIGKVSRRGWYDPVELIGAIRDQMRQVTLQQVADPNVDAKDLSVSYIGYEILGKRGGRITVKR